MTAAEQNLGWQIASVAGHVAGRGIDEWFETGFAPVSDSRQPEASAPELSPEYLMPCLATDRPVWVLLPAGELRHKERWQAECDNRDIQFGFGRAGLALAMGSIHRSGVPAQILAADSRSGMQLLTLMLKPGPGPGLCFSALDGRIDGTNELAGLLTKAQAAVPDIEVLVCPGYPQDRGLERLMPFLGSLARWNRPGLRWEFPEQTLPSAGVTGALWGLYWLLDGYRLGDWCQPGALLLLDEDSPLAGIITVAPGDKRRPWQITGAPEVVAINGNRELSV